MKHEVGDFVLVRADGVVAYQFAVVIDDEAQGVTDVVRGADLLDSTPRQIHLQELLGFAPPRYLHVPVVTDGKLSKQTRARPLDRHQAGALILAALRFLGQSPPGELDRAPAAEIWRWAIHSFCGA